MFQLKPDGNITFIGIIFVSNVKLKKNVENLKGGKKEKKLSQPFFIQVTSTLPLTKI